MTEKKCTISVGKGCYVTRGFTSDQNMVLDAAIRDIVSAQAKEIFAEAEDECFDTPGLMDSYVDWGKWHALKKKFCGEAI